MAWIWIGALFIAKTVAAWGTFLQTKGYTSSADIFGLGGGRKLSFGKNV